MKDHNAGAEDGPGSGVRRRIGGRPF